MSQRSVNLLVAFGAATSTTVYASNAANNGHDGAISAVVEVARSAIENMANVIQTFVKMHGESLQTAADMHVESSKTAADMHHAVLRSGGYPINNSAVWSGELPTSQSASTEILQSSTEQRIADCKLRNDCPLRTCSKDNQDCGEGVCMVDTSTFHYAGNDQYGGSGFCTAKDLRSWQWRCGYLDRSCDKDSMCLLNWENVGMSHGSCLDKQYIGRYCTEQNPHCPDNYKCINDTGGNARCVHIDAFQLDFYKEGYNPPEVCQMRGCVPENSDGLFVSDESNKLSAEKCASAPTGTSKLTWNKLLDASENYETATCEYEDSVCGDTVVCVVKNPNKSETDADYIKIVTQKCDMSDDICHIDNPLLMDATATYSKTGYEMYLNGTLSSSWGDTGKSFMNALKFNF